MSQAPLSGVREMFSFWRRAFKEGFLEAWAILDHLNNAFGLLAAVGLIFAFVKLDMNYWVVVAPVSLFLLVTIYKVMIKGPYKVYVDLLKTIEADRLSVEISISNLRQQVEAFSNTRATLEIIPEIQPTVRRGYDLHFLVRVKNHGPATAEKVMLRLESVTGKLGTKSVGRSLTRWSSSEKEDNTVTDIHFPSDETWGLIWTDYNFTRFHTVESLGLPPRRNETAGSDQTLHNIDCELLISATSKNSDKKEVLLRFQWTDNNPPMIEQI